MYTVGPAPAPQFAVREPDGGHVARWAHRREAAMWLCQAHPDTKSLPQALTCALNAAYPEAAPWTNPGVWAPWMREAAAAVEADILRSASIDGGSPTAWQLAVWVQGPRAIDACRRAEVPESQIPLCVASTIYPGHNWARLEPWQASMLQALAQISYGHARVR